MSANELREILLRMISTTGPISVADYMDICMMHPRLGYYCCREPLGTRGDFITSPEISQMFGELLGLCVARSWMDQGSPSRFVLAELGPGRGTMMADMIRATRHVSGFHESMRLVLIERSEQLRQVQQERLAGSSPIFSEDIHILPEGPLFIVANEFFDALPIRQFVRTAGRWEELRVGQRDGKLVIGRANPTDMTGPAEQSRPYDEGLIKEVRRSAEPYIDEISTRIATEGGLAILIDYGGWQLEGSSLQAVHRHARVDFLFEPGKADLTSLVDFAELADYTRGRVAMRLACQGPFLEHLGIKQRLSALVRGLDKEAATEQRGAYRRLTHREEMGETFKVLGLWPMDASLPPGFA